MTWARWEPSKMFAGTSREISSAAVGMEGNNRGNARQQQWGCPGPPSLGPRHPRPPPSCSSPPWAQGWVAASQPGAPRDPDPWLLWPGGPHDQWPSIPAPHPRGTAGHPQPVLPSWQSRELCAFSTRIPPGCGEAVSELVRRRDQPRTPVPQGHACSPGSDLGAVPLPVLPLCPKGCSDPSHFPSP